MCLLLSLPCAGCGPSDLARAQGTVQLEGRPVAGGSIVLLPVGDGQPASGTILSDGSFVLTTRKVGDGATVGRHRVTVVGDRAAADEDAQVSYLAPDDFLLEVRAGELNQLLIDIRQDAGWRTRMDD